MKNDGCELSARCGHHNGPSKISCYKCLAHRQDLSAEDFEKLKAEEEAFKKSRHSGLVCFGRYNSEKFKSVSLIQIDSDHQIRLSFGKFPGYSLNFRPKSWVRGVLGTSPARRPALEAQSALAQVARPGQTAASRTAGLRLQGAHKGVDVHPGLEEVSHGGISRGVSRPQVGSI